VVGLRPAKDLLLVNEETKRNLLASFAKKLIDLDGKSLNLLFQLFAYIERTDC
jgi:hypothetical protein